MNALGAKFSAVGLIFVRILKVCNSLIFSVLCYFMPKTPLFYPLKTRKMQQNPCV